jgi:hypothetical protein
LHLVAIAHADVVALRRDIDHAVLGIHFDAHVGILLQHFREPRPQDAVHHVVDGGDADGAGRPIAQVADRGDLRIDLLQPRRHVQQQALPGLRR